MRTEDLRFLNDERLGLGTTGKTAKRTRAVGRSPAGHVRAPTVVGPEEEAPGRPLNGNNTVGSADGCGPRAGEDAEVTGSRSGGAASDRLSGQWHVKVCNDADRVIMVITILLLLLLRTVASRGGTV